MHREKRRETKIHEDIIYIYIKCLKKALSESHFAIPKYGIYCFMQRFHKIGSLDVLHAHKLPF